MPPEEQNEEQKNTEPNLPVKTPAESSSSSAENSSRDTSHFSVARPSDPHPRSKQEHEQAQELESYLNPTPESRSEPEPKPQPEPAAEQFEQSEQEAMSSLRSTQEAEVSSKPASRKPLPENNAGEDSFDVDAEHGDMDIEVSPVTREFQKKEDTWIKALRTYKSDVQEALEKNKGSLTRIVIAEQKKKQEQEKKREAESLAKERGGFSFFTNLFARLQGRGEEKSSAEALIEGAKKEEEKKIALRKAQEKLKERQKQGGAKVPTEPLQETHGGVTTEAVYVPPESPEDQREVSLEEGTRAGTARVPLPSESMPAKESPPAPETPPPPPPRTPPNQEDILPGIHVMPSEGEMARKEKEEKKEVPPAPAQEKKEISHPLQTDRGQRKPQEEKVPTPQSITKTPTVSEYEESEETSLFQKNIIVFLASVLLFLVGLGLVYGAYLIIKGEPNKEPLELSQGIIIVEKQKQAPLEELSREAISRIVKDEIDDPSLSFHEIKSVYFVKNVLVSREAKEVSERPSIGVLGVRELFFILESNMPPGLLRALTDREFLFGVHALERQYPFLVIKIDAFENAFAGMLKWERFMRRDIAPLFAIDVDTQQVSTESFEDEVIGNRDARILKDDGDNIILMYSFVDRETIVITTNEQTFDEVVNRLKAPKRVIR